MVWRRKILRLVVAVILAASLTPQTPAISEVFSGPGAQTTSLQPLSDPERFGLDFISSIDVLKNTPGALAQRYSWASQAGANWNRWPFYWPEIETQNNSFNYSYHDTLVDSDVAQGIRINAVLMNTPGWATSATRTPYGVQVEPTLPPRLGQRPLRRFQSLDLPPATAPDPATYPPANLYSAVFSDGTDVAGPGKTISQGNYWARFVYNTVSRYRGKVSAWEIWNEPDYKPTSTNGWGGYWSGSVVDYARLLKVGYLAAKQADPSAMVLMGGMSYWFNPAFFGQLLDQIKMDASAAANNYFFDVTAWHWYSRASQMYDMVMLTRNWMSSRGIAGKPIWVNESGIPAWDDPTHPPFGGANRWYPGSGSVDEQASYVIQALAYGLAAGVDKSFIFQEYDDGNGEAFGLIQNNGTPRPAYVAMQVAAQYFESYTSTPSRSTVGNVERITFWGTPKGKVTVLWNLSGSDLVYVAASSNAGRAYLVDKAGNITNLNPSSPSFSIFLPRATDNNNPGGTPDYIVGGSPVLLVEEIGVDNSNLRGTIKDNRDNPVIGAVATAGARTSNVDGDGVYRLTLPSGSVSLQAGKGGYGTLPPASLWIPPTGIAYYNFNLPPSSNAVANGDFETGLSNWTVTGVITPQLTSNPHTGSYALVLGGSPPQGGDSTAEQWINVPNVSQPTLSFTYWLQTSDVAANDSFQVKVVREDGGATSLLQDLQPVSGYTHRWFDLSPWAGTRVRLVFNVSQSSPGNPTTVYLDEVSVGPASHGPYRQYLPLVNKNFAES